MRKAFFDRTAALLMVLPAIILGAQVTVDFSKTHQTIDGFGGSSAWCSAYNAATADALFGNKENQLGLTILRLRIDPGNSWATEKTNATMAKARGATVFATPWSPPTSMKSNGNVVKGYIIATKFTEFAAWMKSFWTYCGEGNVDIMSIENEPDYAQQISYEGCGWTAQNFVDFCKTYAPQIGKPIMMPESMNYSFALSDPTLNDAAAAANVTYIGGHLYGTQPKKYTLALNKGKHVWETEHYYTGDGASSCMSTAKEIMDCMNCDFSAYVWWWMTYSASEGLYYGGNLQHRGWVIAQFSKWVRPGFVRVDATYNPQSGVYVVAFKGATTNVIVAMNNSSSSQSVTFAISNATVTVAGVTKYTSSQSKSGANDGAMTVTNNSFAATLDAQCVSTFVWGTPSSVEPRYGINPNQKDAEKQWRPFLTSNAESGFLYQVNGKRLSISGINEARSQAPGIFIMPGNTQIGNGAVKALHVSKK